MDEITSASRHLLLKMVKASRDRPAGKSFSGEELSQMAGTADEELIFILLDLADRRLVSVSLGDDVIQEAVVTAKGIQLVESLPKKTIKSIIDIAKEIAGIVPR